MDKLQRTQLLNAGVFYLNSGDSQSALKCFNTILAEEPNDAEALNNKGALLLDQGHLANALSIIEAALQQNPDNAESWNNRALCLFHMQEAGVGSGLQEAIENLNRSIELKSSYKAAWENKCIILIRVQQYEQTLECANEALNTGIVTSTIFSLKGEALYLLGRFDVALLNFNSALFLDSRNTRAARLQKYCLDAINQLPSQWRNNMLVYENLIDERHLPNLNREFERKQEEDDDWWDETHIDTGKLIARGFDTSTLKLNVPAEAIQRIERVHSASEVREMADRTTKLALLCGSGISADAPSNLPTGRQYLEELINVLVPQSKARKQLLADVLETPEHKVPPISFEGFLQIIQELVDQNIHFLDIFSFCDVPNRNHLFLAQMIKDGHIVLTTNFDNLIEKAFDILFPNDQLCVLVTDEDYSQFLVNPERPRYVLCKLHGSLTDRSGRDTRDTIRATAFQVGKEGFAFMSEPNKKKMIEDVMEWHPLVVMGYSGYDEVDIVALLKGNVRSDKKIIWVSHKQPGSLLSTGVSRCEIIMAQIKGIPYAGPEINEPRFYICRIETAKIIGELSTYKLGLSRNWYEETTSCKCQHEFRLNLAHFLKEWRDLTLYESWMIPSLLSMIAGLTGEQEERIFYGEESLRLLPFYEKETALEASIQNNLGVAYQGAGNRDKGFQNIKRALAIYESIDDFYSAATVATNMAVFNANEHDYEQAMEYAKKAESLFSGAAVEDPVTMGQLLNLLGGLAFIRGNFLESLDYLKQAESYRRKVGDLKGLIVTINHMIATLDRLDRRSEAIAYQSEKYSLEKALVSKDIVIQFTRSQSEDSA